MFEKLNDTFLKHKQVEKYNSMEAEVFQNDHQKNGVSQSIDYNQLRTQSAGVNQNNNRARVE